MTPRCLLPILLAALVYPLCAQRNFAARPAVTALPAPEKRWALLIGVDEYEDPQIGRLFGAANDARSMKKALTTYAGFPEEQVIVLATGEPNERRPTRRNIVSRLANIIKIVPKDGLLLVGFSGHGIERQSRAFLLTSDSTYNDDLRVLEETAVRVDTVRTWIRDEKIQQVMLFIDACRNDPGGRADAPNRLTKPFTDAFHFDLRNEGIEAFATLYATRIGERAYEYSEKKRGYFSWTLEQALAGKAANDRGEVTLGGLIRYLEQQVPRLTALDLGPTRTQTPLTDVGGYRATDLVLSAITVNAGCSDAAREAWALLRNSTDKPSLDEYARTFPTCEYATVARLRLGANPVPTKPPPRNEAASSPSLPRLVAPGRAVSAAFHPNGRWAVIAGADASLTAWDLASGAPLRRFQGRCGPLSAARVNPLPCAISISTDGRKVISAAFKVLRVWDFASGSLLHELVSPRTTRYFEAVVSPDGATLFAASSESACDIWDLTNHKLIKSLPGHSFSVDLSSDGELLVTGGVAAEVNLYDVKSGNRLWTYAPELGHVKRARFSPLDQLIAVHFKNGKLAVLDAKLGTPKQLIDFAGESMILAFSADASTLVASAYGDHAPHTAIFDIETVRKVTNAPAKELVAVSPDLRYSLVSRPGEVVLCSILSGEELRSVHAGGGLVKSINLLSPVELITTTGDHFVTRWLRNSKAESIGGSYSLFTAFDKGSRALAGAGHPISEIQMLRSQSGTWEKVAALDKVDMDVDSISVSVENQWACTSSSGSTKVWNLASGNLTQVLDIALSKFSPDGQFLIGSTLGENEIRLYRRGANAPYRIMKGHTDSIEDAVLSPSNDFAVSGARDKTVRIWDVKTGLERQTLTGHSDWVNAVAISPDGKLILSGSDDSTVRVWDAETGKQLRILQHDTPIATIVFTPDGKNVATGSYDGVRLWDPRTGRELTGPPPAQP